MGYEIRSTTKYIFVCFLIDGYLPNILLIVDKIMDVIQITNKYN